jgi:hypothetical protein
LGNNFIVSEIHFYLWKKKLSSLSFGC